jgi:hypothetical protein
MKKTHAKTSRRLLPFIAALCLCAGAAAQEREQAKGLEPTAAQRAEAERMRGALAEVVGGRFEVARHRLARRSNWHGGQLYWLAHLRAKSPGDYYVRYKYRYKDRANPQDPLYTFVEHKTLVRVGPRGCARKPRYNFVCVGDTFILPVLLEEHSGHTFSLESQAFSPGDPATAKALRGMDEAGLHREPVPNPAERFLKYLGSRAHYSPHRVGGYTVQYSATFEAVGPGAFNLSLSPNMPGTAPLTGTAAAAAGSTPIVVLDPKAPVTVLSAKDDAHGYSERFSSTGGGTSFLTTPVILQPGELVTLQYLSSGRRGRPAGGESREEIEAGVKDRLPVITLLPFHVDPAQDYNEWIVEFLPPARRE